MKRWLLAALSWLALGIWGCAGPSSEATPVTAPPSPVPTKAQTLPPSPEPPQPVPTEPARAITLRWLGHSTFLLTSSQGTEVLMDPVAASVGYRIEPMDGVDVVTVGHEHSDHNNVGLAKGSSAVLRGLAGSDWAGIDQQVKDVAIRTVPTFHDDASGAQRGKNAVFVFAVDGLRIAHLSDLGHLLTPDQLAAIGQVDVVMVPVGGFFTIDAAGATKVVEQLNPKVVLPMHYKTPAMSPTWQGTGVEPFLEGKRVERSGTTSVTLSRDRLQAATTVIVLNYE